MSGRTVGGRAGLVVVVSAAIAAGPVLAACTLGFNQFTPGSGADASSGDARTDGSRGSDGSPDLDVVDGGQPPDAVTAADGCAGALDCIDEAGACGAACGQTSQQCQSQCPTPPCRNGCVKTEQACRTACASACTACALGERCSGSVGCLDAASAP